MSILPKFLTLKWNISRTIWRIEVGDSSFFCIVHALSFELNFFFRPEVPFNGFWGETKDVSRFLVGKISLATSEMHGMEIRLNSLCTKTYIFLEPVLE